MKNCSIDFFTVGEVEEKEIFGHLDFLFRDEDSPFMLGLSNMIKDYHRNKKVSDDVFLPSISLLPPSLTSSFFLTFQISFFLFLFSDTYIYLAHCVSMY